MPYLLPNDCGVVIRLFVQPRASKNQLTGLVGDELKLRLTSPPVDGAANALCIKFLAKLLKRPKSDLELIAGDKSRHKRVLVKDADVSDVRQVLDGQL